jgi:peptide/nickel transport system substrate-binding protein
MRGRAPWRCALLLLLSLGGPAPGAARAAVGGALSVGLVGLPLPAADAAAAGPLDSPESASALGFLALPLCRLLPEAVPVVANVGRPAGGPLDEVLVTPLAEARFSDGAALSAKDVADAVRRLALSQSPYVSLLAPVAHLEEALDGAAQHPEAPLRLRLLYAWPDLEASLCHPAFTPTRGGAAQGVGLYGPLREGRAPALQGAPGGPPYPASVAFSTLPARSAARLLEKGEVQALLGERTGADGGPRLYATYLVYRQGGLPEGAVRALLHLDLEALVRTFVPGPAAPLRGLLPETLAEAGPSQPPAKRAGVAASAARAFSLGYEAGVLEQRAVAERLQVLLHDAGYAVRLVPGTRAALSRARTQATLEAALVSVLLPPLPAPALALVLGLTGDMGLLGRELPALGAMADAPARGAKAAARARELLQDVPLVPLYVRGLRVQLAAPLIDARRDAFGLLVLDDAWLLR